MRHALLISLFLVLWPLTALAQDGDAIKATGYGNAAISGSKFPSGGGMGMRGTGKKKGFGRASVGETQKARPTSDPKLRPKLRVVSDGRELLEPLKAVCGGEAQIITEKEGSKTRYIAQCNTCPKDDGASGNKNLRVGVGYVGDFSGEGHEEAILTTAECRSDEYRHSKSVILRREKDQNWKVLARAPSLFQMEMCMPVRAPDRDMLVCAMPANIGSTIVTNVRLVSLNNDKMRVQNLIKMLDSSPTCQFENNFKNTVDLFVVDDIDSDKNLEIAVGITGISGSPKGGDVVKEVDRCDRDAWDFTEKKSLEVWEFGPEGLRKDSEAAKSTKHAKLVPYKKK